MLSPYPLPRRAAVEEPPSCWPAQLTGGGKLTCSQQQSRLRGTNPGKGKETGVTPRGGWSRGRQCPAPCTYPSGGDPSAGRARKSQRKMASPTLMTCRWSGVKATWCTGSEWPMYTWERAHPELLHHHPCPARCWLLRSPPRTARANAPRRKIPSEASTTETSSHHPLRGQHHTLQCSDLGLTNWG